MSTNRIDLNIPHIIDALKGRDVRFLYVMETFVG
jgi:hypothetical protein